MALVLRRPIGGRERDLLWAQTSPEVFDACQPVGMEHRAVHGVGHDPGAGALLDAMAADHAAVDGGTRIRLDVRILPMAACLLRGRERTTSREQRYSLTSPSAEVAVE